jgi:hypothetical protein
MMSMKLAKIGWRGFHKVLVLSFGRRDSLPVAAVRTIELAQLQAFAAI